MKPEVVDLLPRCIGMVTAIGVDEVSIAHDPIRIDWIYSVKRMGSGNG